MTIATTNTKTFATSRKVSFFLQALNWLASHDAAYRENARLKAMPQHRLDDMGMTRDDANRAFYQRFNNRAADKLWVGFHTRW